MGSWDKSWIAVKELWTLAVCSNALWVGACSRILSNPIAARENWNKYVRPHGPRHSGPMAPVGCAQNTIATADVFLRFGGATTSKSDLDCFWLSDYSMLLLFFDFLFLGGKDIIIQPHLFNCSNWSHSKWALPFICNGNDYEIVFVLSSLVWWVRVEWWNCLTRFHPLFLEYCFSLLDETYNSVFPDISFFLYALTLFLFWSLKLIRSM